MPAILQTITAPTSTLLLQPYSDLLLDQQNALTSAAKAKVTYRPLSLTYSGFSAYERGPRSVCGHE